MWATRQSNREEAMSLGTQGPPSLSDSQHHLSTTATLPCRSDRQGYRLTIHPSPRDVLCGKTKQCVDHDGSKLFRAVIECHREQYQQALTKWDKTNVTRTIYDNLSQAGSRFLKHNDSLKIWEEITPMAARDKIGHALRFANRVTRRKGHPDSNVIIADKTEVIPRELSTCATVNFHPQAGGLLDSLSSVTQAQPPKAQLPPLGCLSTQTTQLQPQAGTPQLLTLECASAMSNPGSSIPPVYVVGQSGGLPMQGMQMHPLIRSQEWFQNKDTQSIKFLSKTTVPLATSNDDSLSLLDGILACNQSANEPATTIADLSFDLDFDAEILSILL